MSAHDETREPTQVHIDLFIVRDVAQFLAAADPERAGKPVEVPHA